MNSIKKEFVSYELALKLKELGFDEECFGAYHNEDNLDLWTGEFDYSYAVKAPLWQQAFDWFRKKYGLHSTITSISQESWQWHITKPGETLGKLYDEDFYTYQEARQACLESLIEMIKK